MTSSRRASLLVVLAHPDDETFHGGMLTHLSEQGVRVTLACATNGEAGKPPPSVGSVDDLGALRVEELRLSCDRLGIEPPVLLGFHDSARRTSATRRPARPGERGHARGRGRDSTAHSGAEATRRPDV
jgi:LmbE family N-acetylglucosaminyl deacetylase